MAKPEIHSDADGSSRVSLSADPILNRAIDFRARVVAPAADNHSGT